MSGYEPVINGPPATKDVLLLQLFVQSLKRAAFTWYANLLENFIASWQHEFLRHSAIPKDMYEFSTDRTEAERE